MSSYKRIANSRRGWIAWTWGKLGSLLVFMGVMLMMLSAYGFIGSAMQADKAAGLARDLRDNMLDCYNSVGDMSFEYALPQSLMGENYSIELMDKGVAIGIIVTSGSGAKSVMGGASLPIPLSENSLGMLKDFGENLPYICMVKYSDRLYIQKSRCT